MERKTKKNAAMIAAGVVVSGAIGYIIYGFGRTSLTDRGAVPEDSIIVQTQEWTDAEEPEHIGKIAETGEIIEIYLDIYENMAEADSSGSLERMRTIVTRLGENGYVAVDSENQIDMTRAEQVIQFVEKVNDREEADLTIVVVSDLGRFKRFDLQTEAGKVSVVQNYYQYESGQMKNKGICRYYADLWEYTEDGYLMFSGVCFSEELYALTLSGTEEHVALRVQPLDEKCRELNRKYILPVGYGQNNMFLVDWSEEDFGELDFYDVFDIFYPKVKGTSIPYVIDNNLEVGAVYQISREEFESVIMTYFHIDSKTLQSVTVYDSGAGVYEYKPRGFYEVEYPEYPYPEVVEFMENSDGTITLTVNVVFPYAGIAKVYAHEVVVRPLEGGGVRYVSNRVVPSKDNYEETWHRDRLTKEEWEEIYGGVT